PTLPQSFPTRRSSDLEDRDVLRLRIRPGVHVHHDFPLLLSGFGQLSQRLGVSGGVHQTTDVGLRHQVLKKALLTTDIALRTDARSEEHTSELQSRENL